jgi:hypothetical protein
VEGKGRGTWVQSFYAKSIMKSYELMLKKDVELKQFLETPPQEVDTAAKDFPEKVTLGVSEKPYEFDEKLLSDLEWLHSINNNYFVAGHRKVFSKNPRIL